MLARLHVDGAQHVVDATHLYVLAVDRSGPARIVNLREHDHAALRRLHGVAQLVRLVLVETHERCALLLYGVAQRCLELAVGYSLVMQVETLDGVELLVGVVDILEAVDEPRVAVSVRVLQRHGLSALQRHDDILGVEHIEHRINRVARHACHIALSLGDGRHRLLHLGCDVFVDKLLVAAQLGCVVTTNRLMIVRRLVLVERVRREVQHAIVGRCVLQNLAVGGGLLLRSLAHAALHEHRVVEVALVHLPHIHEAEREEERHSVLRLQFLQQSEHEDNCSGEYHEERTPAVGCEYRDTNLAQIADERREILARYRGERAQLGVRHEVGEEHRRHDGERHAHARRKQEAEREPRAILHLAAHQSVRSRADEQWGSALEEVLCLQHLLQSQHSKQRNGELGDDEYRRHGAELGVHRNIVEEEVGEPHEVSAPREQHGEHCRSEQRPLHRAFHDEQTQHEEHHHERSDVHRTACARLVAPVLTHLLIYLVELGVGFLHSLLVLRQRHRSAALGVRHEQRPSLVDAVAPLRDIVAVETARSLVGRVLLHQLALAAHRLLRILPCMVEVGEVDHHAQHRRHRAHRRSLGETRHLLLAQSLYEIGYDHEQHDEQIVVSHLHVVGLNLERREQTREHEAPNILAAVGEHDARNHRRQISQRNHLPDVSGGDDDEEVAAESP